MKKHFRIISIIIAINAITLTAYGQKHMHTPATFEHGQIICSDNAMETGKLYVSSKEYDETVIGVYFIAPTNEENNDGSPILINPNNNTVLYHGITTVKYSNYNGKIMKGDPITSSKIPGVAMKATSSGTIIGIALEDTKTNEGYVKCRILIQYYRQ